MFTEITMTWSAKVVLRKDHICTDGTCQVVLRVRVNRLRKREFPFGHRVRMVDFDEVTGRMRPNAASAKDLNLLFDHARARATAIFVEFRLASRELTLEKFAHEYKHPHSRQDFLAFWREESKRRWNRENISDATRTIDKTVMRKVSEFHQFWLLESRLDDDRPLCFTDVDKRWMEDFDAWHLRKLRRLKGRDLVNHGAGPRWNAIKVIKVYLRIGAGQHGAVIAKSAFDFKTVAPVDRRCALSMQEFSRLRSLEKEERTPAHLRNVLRYFIFACVTGLRISDIRRIRWELIEENVLEFVPFKTRRSKLAPLRIPLTTIAQSMLPEQRPRGRIFPVYSDPVTNRHLKDIADRAALSPKLSFKWSRDTFATLFLELGGTVEVLQQILGHTKIQQTMKYVTITEQRKAQQMTAWDLL